MTEPDTADSVVTEASLGDTSAIAGMLATAFVDDPAASWLLDDPDPASREQRLATFFYPIVRGTIANGLALHSDQCRAATLWRLPGRIHPGFFETLSGLPHLRRGLGDGAERAKALGDMLKEKTPSVPYWYLQFAGVAPEAQHKGRGGRLIREGLERAKRAGFPVYLETAKAENAALYQHLGFRIVDEWDIPGNGPRFWGMLHE